VVKHLEHGNKKVCGGKCKGPRTNYWDIKSTYLDRKQKDRGAGYKKRKEDLRSHRGCRATDTQWGCKRTSLKNPKFKNAIVLVQSQPLGRDCQITRGERKSARERREVPDVQWGGDWRPVGAGLSERIGGGAGGGGLKKAHVTFVGETTVRILPGVSGPKNKTRDDHVHNKKIL